MKGGNQESTTCEEAIASNQTDILDVDNVFTKYNRTDSIGKRIKHKAVAIHNQYIDRVDSFPAAKFVMETGLSSILDLTHPENNHQGYLFSKEETTKLECTFLSTIPTGRRIRDPCDGSHSF
jgi:hypothetical protein